MTEQQKIIELENKVNAYMERGLELQVKINELEKERTELYIMIGKDFASKLAKELAPDSEQIKNML